MFVFCSGKVHVSGDTAKTLSLCTVSSNNAHKHPKHTGKQERFLHICSSILTFSVSRSFTVGKGIRIDMFGFWGRLELTRISVPAGPYISNGLSHGSRATITKTHSHIQTNFRKSNIQNGGVHEENQLVWMKMLRCYPLLLHQSSWLMCVQRPTGWMRERVSCIPNVSVLPT